MSEEFQEHVLSREELDALLGAMEASRRDEPGAAPFRRARAPGSAPALRRALEQLGTEYGKSLSSRHQTRIGLSLLGFESVALPELAETLLPTDRVVVAELEPGAGRAFVLVSRPLLFAWLVLRFGGRPMQGGAGPVPGRAYTGIEGRVLRRVAADGLEALDRFVGSRVGVRSRVVALEDARVLLDEEERQAWLASFDVTGIGELGRLRFVLPKAAFRSLEGAAKPASRPSGSQLRRSLLDVRVRLRAEVGGADLSLARFAELRPGDVIPIEAREDGSLLICVGQTPKFRALRGTLGRRLAVQVVERLKESGETNHATAETA